jgi:hypothetical protein
MASLFLGEITLDMGEGGLHLPTMDAYDHPDKTLAEIVGLRVLEEWHSNG